MSNELATVDNTANALGNFTGGIFSSIQGESQEERLELFDKVSKSESLADQVGNVLNVQDIIIQEVMLEGEDGEEPRPARRIVLVTDKGDAYGCTSSGIETAMRNIFAIVGNAPWMPALPLKVVEQKGRNGWKFLSVEYAPKGK